MTETQPYMFSLPSPEKRLGSHTARIKHALEIYSSRGLTLEQISSPKVMNRTLSVLKRYCRQFSIKFPDYVPDAMKEKPIEKETRKTKRKANTAD